MAQLAAGRQAARGRMRRCSPVACLLVASNAASVSGGPSPWPGDLEAAASHRGSELAPLETRDWTERRLATSRCTLPGNATLFSVVTEGPAQISSNQVYGPLHIGGRVTSNPTNPFYTQKVRSFAACTARPHSSERTCAVRVGNFQGCCWADGGRRATRRRQPTAHAPARPHYARAAQASMSTPARPASSPTSAR